MDPQRFASLVLCEGYLLVTGGSTFRYDSSLQWHHNGRDGVPNHQPHDCLLKLLFRRGSKKTPKLGVTGLCARKSPVTDEFPAQMASNAGNVSIWWRHHVIRKYLPCQNVSMTMSLEQSTRAIHLTNDKITLLQSVCFRRTGARETEHTAIASLLTYWYPDKMVAFCRR